jgi:hypothetical protein
VRRIYQIRSDRPAGSRPAVSGRTGHVFKFAAFTIKPHGYVTIHTGKGSRTQTDRYWNRSWYIWNNTGDQATLENQNGTVIDRCSYRGTNEGYLFC